MPDISTTVTVPLVCPECSAHFSGELWAILHVDERPDLAQNAASGTLNTFTCPQEHTFTPSGPMLCYFSGQAPLLFYPEHRMTFEQLGELSASLLNQAYERLGSEWRDDWSADGISALPLTYLPLALKAGPEAALQRMMDDAKREMLRNLVRRLEENSENLDSSQRVTICSQALQLFKRVDDKELWDYLTTELKIARNDT